MKQVCVEALGTSVSSIGFGCASLGGRIGARKGIEALERAYEAGITWYDVAPSYGDGMAESIWGQFASKKRDSVYICTKVGMRPANTSAAMRLLKPIARASLAIFPGLQKQVSGVRPKPIKVPLSAELIRTSVEESLRRLRTDYVDVLALHRPAIEEIVREDIVRAVERVVRDGKARAISIAGNCEAAIGDLDESLPYRLVQIANNPLEPNLQKSKEHARRRTFVTYGSFSSLERLATKINAQKEILSGLHEVGYRGNLTEIAAAFLVDYALATNAAGVTLFSMFQKEHLDFNLLRSKQHPTLDRLNAIVAALSK
ncbi:oxidoreductase [Bradyrhizobium centrolobii]|uniref:Oxidoreductase n=1 Tax=Bradyrhizobium centrolobii TaxID=1505087 RepID=A0A176YSQ1_9BRAD|nr:aldo/keto reductase [Bradyrhizobium centrolobii]OAF10691.1 oxidoreductase [Bradyrhizobium centrolobii]